MSNLLTRLNPLRGLRSERCRTCWTKPGHKLVPLTPQQLQGLEMMAKYGFVEDDLHRFPLAADGTIEFANALREFEATMAKARAFGLTSKGSEPGHRLHVPAR